MKISEIYRKYRIPPQLQLHQLRVAAIAKLICDNLTAKVDAYEVVSADLLHDMGNIIKFDLTLFPEYLKPEGLDYWQAVKSSFIEKYGNDEHIATEKIVMEVTDNKRIHQILRYVGGSKIDQVNKSEDYSFKIVNYADDRVSVNGVVSVKELINERKARNNKSKPDGYYETLDEKILLNENNIQKVCRVNSDNITEDMLVDTVYDLGSFEIY